MIEYYIDNINLKQSYGLHVSSSSGLIHGLTRKDPRKQSYADRHGEYVDLSKPRFESREIKLNCFIKAESKVAFIASLNQFLAAINGAGMHRLEVALDGAKKLFYEVYCKDGVSVNAKWTDGEQVGSFSVKLIEPNPVKNVVKVTLQEQTVELSFQCNDYVHVFWGDGEAKYDVSGTVNLSHEYDEDVSESYIIIAGNVESLSDISVNGGTHSIL